MNRKILFLAESMNVGGAEKALVSILRLIDYSQYDVTLLLISETGPFVTELSEIEGLRVKSIVRPNNSSHLAELFNALKVKAVYKWLPARIVGNYLCHGYDVVIAFCEGYLTKWVGAASVSCRKIAWVHTDMVDNDWPLNTGVFNSPEEEIRAYHKFETVVGVSNLVTDGIRQKFGCNNVATIYNILDPGIFEKANTECLTIPKRKLNIVGVGRLEYVKGFDQLIEALGFLVNENGYDIHLTLVGDGSLRAKLEMQVQKLKLQDNVLFVGSHPNPYPFINQADLFVCPSRQEGFNIAVLEAMTLGKAIISTDSVGPREILADGKFGIVTDNNPEALAKGIQSFYNTNGIIKHYSNLSIERAKDFNSEVQMRIITSLFQ